MTFRAGLSLSMQILQEDLIIWKEWLNLINSEQLGGS